MSVSKAAKHMEDDIWHKLRAEKDPVTSVRTGFLVRKYRFTLDLRFKTVCRKA